jgi:hypothetical protein
MKIMADIFTFFLDLIQKYLHYFGLLGAAAKKTGLSVGNYPVNLEKCQAQQATVPKAQYPQDKMQNGFLFCVLSAGPASAADETTEIPGLSAISKSTGYFPQKSRHCRTQSGPPRGGPRGFDAAATCFTTRRRAVSSAH